MIPRYRTRYADVARRWAKKIGRSEDTIARKIIVRSASQDLLEAYFPRFRLVRQREKLAKARFAIRKKKGLFVSELGVDPKRPYLWKAMVQGGGAGSDGPGGSWDNAVRVFEDMRNF